VEAGWHDGRGPVAADVPQRTARGWVMHADYAKMTGFAALNPAVPGLDFLP
jgi:hypothetical protein